MATPALTSSNPANGAVYTSTAAVPAVLKVTYNETLNSPTSPVFPSHISVTLNGAFFGCTAGLDTDQKTLTCTPYAGTVYTDGVYVISTTASPSVTTGDTTAAHDSVSFTVDTTPPTITNRTPAPDSRVQPPSSVVATYAEKLSAAGSAITVTNSIGNVVGGASAVTNPTSTTGGITWIPDAPLPSGLFNVSAQATDLHGLVSTSTWQFTVDADPPSPPVVVVPAYVNAANENHVPITGTAVNDTGGAVKVRVTASDGATTLTLPDVNVGNDGSWSAAPVADLSGLKDGPVTITAKAIDAAGNLSTDSTPQASTKDTAAPTPPPSVTFPDATVVNASNSTLHVHGVTEPDAGVSVVATDKNATATAPVTTTASHSDGSYDAVIDTASLADGTLTITATATDAAGNTSSGSNTIQKDATPSGTPTISVFDPVNASNVGTPRPVSGTATAGDHVDVWLTDATDTATKVSEQPNVLVQPDGSWSTTVDASTLADGPITVHAVDIDGGGNPSAEATKVTVKDTVVPNAPAYTAPTWINNATQSAVTLSGTAEPGTTLHLVATDSGAGSQAVNLPVQSDGTWTTTPALDLHTFAEGAVTFAATVVDQAGNTSSSTPGSSTKDTQAPSAPAAPTLSGPASGTSVYTATGSGTTGDSEQVTMTSDGGAGSASGSGSVVSSAYSVPVDAASLADGTLSAVATETDPAGNTSAESPASTVVKDTTAPFSLVSTVPADGSSVQTTPTLSATFNEQLDLSQSSVTLKDSTGSVLPHNAMQLSADKKTISVSPSNNPLAESSGYQVTFAVTELSHDESLSPTVTFTVDRTAPAAPAITSIAPIASANATSTPVTGTAAEPGGTIKVTLTDGTHNATGSGVVAGDGTWTVPVDASTLNDGTVSGTATQTDAAGNESGDSAAAQATKDTVAPAAPTVAWSGAVTQHALSVVLSGTAEPNSTVRVNVDDNDASTVAVGAVTTATAGGSWSTPVDLSGLRDGALTALAWATDGFGNVGPTASANGLKDTVAPSAFLTAPRSAFNLGAVTARWRATDAGSGLASAPYDVRWARQAHGKPMGAYRMLAAGVTATSVREALAAGTTACFEVRAHDAVGNVSGWTAPRCSTAALDDSSMTPSAGWTRVKNRRLYHGSAFTTTAHGATLTLPASSLDRVAVVVTRCPTCGSIAIFVGGQRIKVVDLSSATTRRRVVFSFAQFPLRTAKVTIKVVSRGKQVQVDGVGTSGR